MMVIGLIWIFRKREEDERHLGWKLVGYYLLGTFSFQQETYAIPIGYMIFWFLKPKCNKKVKTYAATFGFIMFLLFIGIQYVQHLSFEHSVTLETKENTFEDWSFTSLYDAFENKMPIEENIKVNYYGIEWAENGHFNRMTFEFLDIHENVRYVMEYEGENEVTMWSERIGVGTVHSSTKLSTKAFMSFLDSIDFNDFHTEEEYYVLYGDGTISTQLTNDIDLYRIERGGMTEVEREVIPEQVHLMTLCPKPNEDAEHCRQRKHYIFETIER